jgi:hypothetical protein
MACMIWDEENAWRLGATFSWISNNPFSMALELFENDITRSIRYIFELDTIYNDTQKRHAIIVANFITLSHYKFHHRHGVK